MRWPALLILAAACGPGPMVVGVTDPDLADAMAADPGYLSTGVRFGRDAGAACAYGAQCHSGRCSSTQAMACGICLEVRLLGQTCGSPGQSCGGTAFCDEGVCHSKVGSVGSPCQNQAKERQVLPPCDADLQCLRLPSQHAPTCQRPIRVGGECSDSTQCRDGAHCEAGVCAVDVYGTEGNACGTRCKDGLFCDPSGVCRAMARLGVGDPCGVGTGFCIDSTCGHVDYPYAGWPPGTPLTCLPLGTEGMPSLFGCAAGLFAEANTCRPKRAAGGLCSISECADGLECHGGKCTQPCQ